MLNLGTRWGYVDIAVAWSLYPWQRDCAPIVQEAEWPRGKSGTGVENLAVPGV